jgi:hypothetical protein
LLSRGTPPSPLPDTITKLITILPPAAYHQFLM